MSHPSSLHIDVHRARLQRSLQGIEEQSRSLTSFRHDGVTKQLEMLREQAQDARECTARVNSLLEKRAPELRVQVNKLSGELNGINEDFESHADAARACATNLTDRITTLQKTLIDAQEKSVLRYDALGRQEEQLSRQIRALEQNLQQIGSSEEKELATKSRQLREEITKHEADLVSSEKEMSAGEEAKLQKLSLLREELKDAKVQPRMEPDYWQLRYEALLHSEVDPELRPKPISKVAERLDTSLKVLDAALGIETKAPKHLVTVATALRRCAQVEHLRAAHLREQLQERRGLSPGASPDLAPVDRCFSPPVLHEWDMLAR